MPPKSAAKQALFWVGLIFGLYTTMALLTSLGTYVSETGIKEAGAFGSVLRQEFKDWYACGLLSLGTLWFAGRNRLEPGHLRRWLLFHVVAALICSAAYAVLSSWLVAGEHSVMHPGQILTFSYLLQKYWLHYLVLNLIMYWLVVFAHFGWHYYGQFREREVQNAELQRELVEARLAALRMQLNPHFLFNTLHAVSALIHENPEAADRVLARLSELLRLSLDQSKPQEVPLCEEMAFLDRYLEIEQTRFAERLQVDKQLGPDTQQALVPYLILQPLVENAIRHGIEPREDQGRLGIQARRHDGRLELRVTDNGNGLPDDGQAAEGRGIGLANTRSRLRHLYGKNFSFELRAAESGGLEARIDLPFHTRTPAT